MSRPRSVWIGFEPREAAAFAVARTSIRKHLSQPIPIHGLVLSQLQADGLYRRPTEKRLGRLCDLLSRRADYNGEISTEFALSRFLVPLLAKGGLAMFLDCDMLVRVDLVELFEHCERNPGKAVYCVKHEHDPERMLKMDHQLQTRYSRKNWSSVMLFDCEHEGNRRLTLDYVNSVPGLDLHGLRWLRDDEIGELGQEWNWLVGYSDPAIVPKIVHHTDGAPCLTGFEDVAYADEWRTCLSEWAQGRMGFGA